MLPREARRWKRTAAWGFASQFAVDTLAGAAHAAGVNMDPTWVLLGGLFSLIGFAVFTYGRRQRTATHTVIGVALMVYPYFVSGATALVGIGMLLLVGMFVGNRMENG